jgi:hypothetical protein
MAEIPLIRKLRLRNKVQNLIVSELETQRNSVQQPCSNFDQTTVIEVFRSNNPSPPPPQYQPMQNISNQFRTPRTDQDDQRLLL